MAKLSLCLLLTLLLGVLTLRGLKLYAILLYEIRTPFGLFSSSFFHALTDLIPDFIVYFSITQKVINFSLPKNYSQYIHRVGRTARANRKGRSISIANDTSDRVLLKKILKSVRVEVEKMREGEGGMKY